MRVARCSFLFLIAAVLITATAVWCPWALAADSATADSSVAASLSADPDSIFTIYPVNGEPFQVDYVGSWSTDTIRYRKVSGEKGYLSAARIRRIEDAQGYDHLAPILRERKSFGVWVEDPQRSFGAWLRKPFRAAPDRERRWCLLTEFGISGRPGDGASTGDGGMLFESGIGGIRNLSSNWGIGIVAHYASDARGYQALGAGIRIRRYLSRRYTVETTQGLFTDDDDDDRSLRGIPYFGEAAVTASGSLSLFARIERHHYVREVLLFGYFPDEIEVSDTAVHIGIRLGPRPGYLVLPGVVVGSLLTIERD